jgi:hypothetical protein
MRSVQTLFHSNTSIVNGTTFLILNLSLASVKQKEKPASAGFRKSSSHLDLLLLLLGDMAVVDRRSLGDRMPPAKLGRKRPSMRTRPTARLLLLLARLGALLSLIQRNSPRLHKTSNTTRFLENGKLTSR